MARRTRQALGLAAALAVVALALWQGWPTISRVVATAPARGGLEVVPVPEATPDTATGRDSQDRGRVPLPPDDAPLAGILAPLAARADAGDRKAACRLALELLRCEQMVESAAFQSLSREGSAPTPKEAGATAQPQPPGVDDYVARVRAWTRERLAQCEAVPDHLLDAGARYLEQAALAGEPEAMVRYAEGHHWPPTGRGMMADPAFDRWRRQAPGMMRRALESGYPWSAFLLAIAYRDDFGLHAALIPNDPEQSMVMSMLHARLHGGQGMANSYRDMPAASQARASRQAEDMHNRYFQGRRFHGYPYPMPTYLPPSDADPSPGFCREP